MTPEQRAYLERVWAAAWMPKEKLEGHTWAERNVLSIPYSNEPGPYSSSVSPMHVDIMRLFLSVTTRLISVLAPVQCAKTLCMELMLAWIIANEPGPAAFFQQNDHDAKDHTKTRLVPLFENTIGVRELLPPRHKRSLDFIQFNNGMPLWILGAVPKNLHRRTMRYQIFDEWWRYKETGIINQAMKRVSRFRWNSKVALCSQAGEAWQEGHKIHSTTNCMEQHITCPECGETYPWTFEQIGGYREGQTDNDGKPILSWDFCKKEHGGYDYNQVAKSTVFMCPHCCSIWDNTESNRAKLLQHTSFIATNPDAEFGKIGIHYESNGFEDWGDLGVEYLRGREMMKLGDNTYAKNFKQQRRAIAWEESTEDYEVTLQTGGYGTREKWELEAAIAPGNKIIPGPVEIKGMMAPLRAMFVDAQGAKGGHFYVMIFSLSATGKGRVYHYQGGPGADGVHSWDDLDVIQRECGVINSFVFVDCGWKTTSIIEECWKRGWVPLMGSSRDEWPHDDPKNKGQKINKCYSPNTEPLVRGKHKYKMFMWSNLVIKDMAKAWLRSGNLQLPQDASKDLLNQLEAEEKLFEKKTKGRIIRLKKPRYEPIGDRPNHYWDCLCMCVVLIVMLGLFANEEIIDEEHE